MQTLSVKELAAWLADNAREAPMLLDVREVGEFGYCAIAGSVNIPMGSVPARLDELDPQRQIVCVCHHGMRSAQVAMFLASRGYGKVLNLSGGIDAWSRQVDPTVPVY